MSYNCAKNTKKWLYKNANMHIRYKQEQLMRNWELTIVKYSRILLSPSSIVANMLDINIVVSKFQDRRFRIITGQKKCSNIQSNSNSVPDTC